MVKKDTAYLLWCCTFLGLFGIHRFYLGKPVSGFIYLFTGGLFGIGQIVDLFLIPGLTEQKNLKEQLLLNASASAPIVRLDFCGPSTAPTIRLDVSILSICRRLNGATVSDCVIETAAAPEKVKKMIHKLCVDELLVVDNRESDGAVIYRVI